MKKTFVSIAAFLAIVWSLGAAFASPAVIGWEDLVPPKGLGAKMELGEGSQVLGTPAINEFDGSKEDFKLFLEDMKFMKDMQPEGDLINVQLHGREVKIAGYVTPVGFDGEDVTEFLFVPYMGACVHVPPPPANQIVYVRDAKGLKVDQIYEPIWLTGTLQAKSVSTILADVGYSITNGVVEPYTEE